MKIFTVFEDDATMFKKRGKCDIPEDIIKIALKHTYNRESNIWDALRELVLKGKKFEEMEKKYGSIDRREVWDNRFYYLRVEAGYLYYRLRVRELIDELKSLIMIASSLAAELDTCYSKRENVNTVDPKRSEWLREIRDKLEEYIHTYILLDEKELEEKRYAEEEEILDSIENTLEEYRRVFHEEKTRKNNED